MRCLALRPLAHLVPALAAIALATTGAALQAADSAPAQDAQSQQQRIDDLEKRLRAVEQGQPAAAPAAGNPLPGLTFGAYGEVKYGLMRNADADNQWQNGFDNARLTLLPSYQISEHLLFKAEIEFEHGGIAVDADDKQGGAVGIEQAFLDLTVNEHFHWRLPGVDVIPFGYTNVTHEPIYFYSVQRPELANGLIPTTWFAGATSVHGNLTGAVTYQLQISTSLVDDGGDVHGTTDAGTVPALGYEAGISGTEALALARPTTGDFLQVSNSLGTCLNIGYDLTQGLAGSSSVYFTPNVAPRGAYASDAQGVTIGDLGRCALTMVDSELRWRPGKEGIELRGEAVAVFFSSPANLRANNDGDTENNVGDSMWGASGEAAWHAHLPNGGWELVPFYRYTRERLQTSGASGADANEPTGAGDITYHTVGLALFPTPEVVIKFDYRAVHDGSGGATRSDHLLGGVGFFF